MTKHNNTLSILLNFLESSGYPKQEPYRSGLFRIFANTYNETQGSCHFDLYAVDLAKEWKQKHNYNEKYLEELSEMWSGWLDFSHRILEEEIKVSFGNNINKKGSIERDIEISTGCMKNIKIISTNPTVTDC